MSTNDPFDPASIPDDARSFASAVEGALASVPCITTRAPRAIRADREAGRGPFPAPLRLHEARDRLIAGPGGELRLRVFRPAEVSGVYLHLHGGGWTLGAAHHQDPMLLALAEATSLCVVSVDYRLAPEAPYPAGPDDCEAAALWLVESARREFGVSRLFIGGESAGAHLALVTLLRLRDRHGISEFRGANLAYGCFDLAMTPSAREWGTRNLVLSTPIIRWFVDHYVNAALHAEPDVSPLHADLRGMPPALFTLGTLDPLVDDTLSMVERWEAAGAESELAVYPGGIHGFNLLPGRLGEEANARIHRFLNAR